MTPTPDPPPEGPEDPREAATRVLAAADFLWTGRRERWSQLPTELAPRNLDEAYAVQVILRERLSDARGRVAGWSIALVSPSQQHAFGVAQPLVGAIYEGTVYRSPARVRARDFIQLSLGGTLTFRMAQSLSGQAGPHDREAVQRAVSVCVPAIGLVEDRGAGDHAKVGGLQLAAENCWNAGLILGSPIPAWDRINLARMRGRLAFQGKWVADGLTRDLMGHPLDALTWLANELPRRGSYLKTGDWAVLGPFLPLKVIGGGQEAVFSIDGIAPVSLLVL
jgi:2-keto-4-pentenoate hydratase